MSPGRIGPSSLLILLLLPYVLSTSQILLQELLKPNEQNRSGAIIPYSKAVNQILLKTESFMCHISVPIGRSLTLKPRSSLWIFEL